MENQDQTIAVRYVGKKPTAQDNVAKSGKLWEGNGDVQWVTPKQAKILTVYADQWALDEAQDGEAVNRAGGVEIVDAAGGTVVIAESDLTGPVEKMTVAELVAFAQVTYGKTLNGKLGRKVLLDEVVGLVGAVVVVVG